MTDFIAVILAAGEGKRMKTKHSKVTHRILGKALIEWVIDAATLAGIKNKVIVVGHKAEEVKQCMGDKAEYAVQEQQLGTGHAVMQVIPLLKNKGGNIIVMCGDMPLISPDTIKNAVKKHIEGNNAGTILTADFENPAGYGRIAKDSKGKVIKIVEDKDASEEEKKIKEINSGLYCFNTELLVEALGKISNNNKQNEYYLTDVIEILIKQGKKVDTYKIANNYEIMGINDRIQLNQAANEMRKVILEDYMRAGVTIIDPASTYIEPSAKIGMDTIIYPGTIIESNSVIGEECIIGPGSRIINSTVKDRAEVMNSVVIDSEVGENSHIGPFAYLRPGSRIGANVKIGDFVEIKNSVIDDNSKVSHLSYIGDCDVGKNVNFGCGTVVVNYDGVKKHRSTVQDNAFIGCNTNLVSPVRIGKNAYTAAGSTITDEVPEDSLAIARARQENKEGWVKRRREKRNG
ncbi:MAG: bifunctional UDP-N-acetylglucosamine diphosphorylase/glucosamine-1-phosphate N-acetyltransferase GlmU [Deltaproteobacteria bacterium]